MPDTKEKIRDSIDDAASGLKHAGEKVVDKTKDVAREAGKKVEDAGDKIKNMGK